MQKNTTSLKAFTDNPIWRALAIAFALLLGPGLNQAVLAQSVTSSNYFVDNTAGSTNTTFGGTNSSTTPNFQGANFGSFDVNNTDDLLLNGGEITFTSATAPSSVVLTFQLYTPSGPSGQAVGGLQTINLAQVSVSGTTYTYRITNANRSLISLAGAAGTYDVDASFTVNGGRGGTTFSDQTRTASFTVTGTLTPAPTLNPNSIQLAADGAASPTSYYFPNTGTSPQFPGYKFTSSQNAGGTSGAFDINNGQLRLNNTSVTTTEASPNTVSGVVLYYRVRSTSSGGGAFQPITLSQSGTTSGGSKTFIIDPNNASNTNPQPNLVAAPAVTTTGTYAIDIYYQASGVNNSTGTPFTVTYPPTGYSTATFTVGGTPIALTIWTGAINDNWFDSGNWTNGIPNATTNALIRDLGAGNNVPYPNIRSDFRYTTAAGALIYDNTGSGPAQTLNFTMGGSSQASRSIARLVNGQLRVFGTFDNSYDSFIQRENTIMEFAGGNQSITGGSFVRVDISGGGTKTLQGVMNISEALNFMTPNVYTSSANPLINNPYTTLATSAGILSTDITQPSNNVVFLADRASTNYNNGAQLNGENDPSFLYGFVRTTRQGVTTNENRTYGNIGMELNFTGANSPGNVEVTRNTVEAYAPGPGNQFSIRRIFGVRPSDQATNSGGLTATMVFHYRDAETMNLNGPNTITPGTSSIPEDRLTIFVSSNSGNTFSRIGRDGPVDQTNNTVTRTGVRTFATFTLGDTQNPLPVELTAFNAARSGSNALLTWATASEVDNKGFNVQVSADGVTFRNLTFVSSKLTNTLQNSTYAYTDNEEGKTGTRYYRLEQVDLSGKTSYSPVRALNFDGAAASKITLVAYPNPFNSTDLVGLSLQGSTLTDGVAYVKLIDMAGRTVRDQKLLLTGASLSLGDVSELRSGLYVAKVTLPDGTTQTVRIQKQ